ncbi:MAG: SsrA-binding protein SmpB [Alphaproteobacteria bacterium]
MAAPDVDAVRIAAQNRKARHDYTIEDTFEAGIVLTGSEVKSLRAGRANIQESYATEKDGEIYLVNSYIPEYKQAGPFNHEPRRPRKLLLHRREIGRMLGAIQRQGMTLVPLKLYFNKRGMAKLEIGIAKGKRQYEKREANKKRDWERDKQRIMRARG